MLFSRRQRLLIVGCGDVGLRFLRQRQHLIQSGQLRVFVLTSSPKRIAELRALGAVPLLGNLDDSASLRRLRSLADRVLMLAPEMAGPDHLDVEREQLTQLFEDSIDY